MICKNCGSEISDASLFCSNCGAKVEKELTEPVPQKKASSKAIVTVIIIALVIAAIIGAVLFIHNKNGKEELKKQLMRDWSRVESDNGTYYELVLDFSDKEIDYNFESSVSWLNTTIETYKYEVISPDTIRVNYKGTSIEFDVKIKFNDEKTMMTMTPAITNSDSHENWFHH